MPPGSNQPRGPAKSAHHQYCVQGEQGGDLRGCVGLRGLGLPLCVCVCVASDSPSILAVCANVSYTHTENSSACTSRYGCMSVCGATSEREGDKGIVGAAPASIKKQKGVKKEKEGGA